MTMNPSSEALHWRAMRREDARPLAAFERDCAVVDGASRVLDEAAWARRLSDGPYIQENSVLVTDPEGAIAARGWIFYQDETYEVQGFVEGRVHPHWRKRGLGTALLRWLEERALENLNRKAEGRKRILRILYYDRKDNAIDLFRRAGYRFQFAEVEMRWKTPPSATEYVNPEGYRIVPYDPNEASSLYQAYRLAFRTRTDQLQDEDAWTHHFADPADLEFAVALSVLAIKLDQPVGYAVVHRYAREDGTEGDEYWIAQMGVAPDHRRKGLATAMLTDVMRKVQACGAEELYLSVNVNNPGARAAYEAVGFREVKTMTLMRKELD